VVEINLTKRLHVFRIYVWWLLAKLLGKGLRRLFFEEHALEEWFYKRRKEIRKERPIKAFHSRPWMGFSLCRDRFVFFCFFIFDNSSFFPLCSSLIGLLFLVQFYDFDFHGCIGMGKLWQMSPNRTNENSRDSWFQHNLWAALQRAGILVERNSIPTILTLARLFDTKDFFWQIVAGIVSLCLASIMSHDDRKEIGRFSLCLDRFDYVSSKDSIEI